MHHLYRLLFLFYLFFFFCIFVTINIRKVDFVTFSSTCASATGIQYIKEEFIFEYVSLGVYCDLKLSFVSSGLNLVRSLFLASSSCSSVNASKLIFLPKRWEWTFVKCLSCNRQNLSNIHCHSSLSVCYIYLSYLKI